MEYILIAKCDRCKKQHTMAGDTKNDNDYVTCLTRKRLNFSTLDDFYFACADCKVAYDGLIKEQGKARAAFKEGQESKTA